MSAPEYPIGTLYEMAAIPEEAMSRFLAELPSILAECRRLTGVAAAFNTAFAGDLAMQMESPSWVDDTLGVTTVHVAMNGEPDVLTVERPFGASA